MRRTLKIFKILTIAFILACIVRVILSRIVVFLSDSHTESCDLKLRSQKTYFPDKKAYTGRIPKLSAFDCSSYHCSNAECG